MKIYCISILRVCDPGIKNYELKEAYETGFLSELYPGIALSKNTVSTFLNDMGKAVSKIVRYMQNRAAAVSMDHHLLIDGALKSDESKVNSLSDFSRKAKTKGTRDISVLYALEERTYKKIMSVLNRAKKIRSDGEAWQLIRLNPSHEEILQELGLIPKPEEPPKKKPGRPKGSKNKSVSKEQEAVPAEGKRKRGQPKGSKNKPKGDTAAGQS